MTITADDLGFNQSERMTDNADGGGQMSATAIVSGVENSIFDDLSDVDREAGDLSIRKLFARVASKNADKYLDAGAVVWSPPADPKVSVLAFSTGDHYDERADLQERLESGITRGAIWQGYLWGQHTAGQRAVTLWQRLSAPLPVIGRRIELAAWASGTITHSQILWITGVVQSVIERQADSGPYQVRSVTLELAEALRNDYTGSEPSKTDPTAPATLVYDTRYNPEAINLVGCQPLAQEAALGEYTVKVSSIYAPLIPTALNETSLADTTPGGATAALVAANAITPVAFTTTSDSIKPGINLFLGCAALPGTIAITVSGSILTDDSGVMRLAGSTSIGAVDYSAGVITWNTSCPSYGTASKAVSFTPAAVPLRVADTTSFSVTEENRGYVYVLTLFPIPAPASLTVAYRVNDEWYVLADTGTGLLSGVDSSYGSGTLNPSTGTVTITTGALPDVGSEILYAWSTPVSYTSRGGAAVDAPVVRGTTEHPGVAPGTVEIEWIVGATTYALTDTATRGVLAGTGGSGTIRYSTGEWEVRPTLVPAIGTEFTITYDYGDPIEETFSHPIREADGKLSITLNAPAREDTVEVEWNTLIIDYDPISRVSGTTDPTVIAYDDGAGGLPISGGTAGTVGYATGVITWLPDIELIVPIPKWRLEMISVQVEPSSNEGAHVWRQIFDGWQYIDTGASYPNDESGYVKIRYRAVGGDQTVIETFTLESIDIDLTRGYGETITRGSVQFRYGGSRYVDRVGSIYRDPSPLTNSGTFAGTLDPTSGRVRLVSWTAGGSNAVTLDGLVTELAGQPIDRVSFRTPVSPVKSGTLQLRWTDATGTTFSKTVDGSGLLEDGDVQILVDYPRGVVHARFGRWRVVSELTPEELAADWYTAEAIINLGGVPSIWQSHEILADSLIYNAVAQTYLPPDSALLGLDAARLPPDGRALIYRVGMLVLIHHEDSIALQSLTAGAVIDCEQVRLYRVVFEDVDAKRLPADRYTVDREHGLVTLADPLDITGYTGPFALKWSIADLRRVRDTDINGTLTLLRQLSYTFPAGAYVSGMIYIGTLQARVSNLFAQNTWTGVWSDELIGDAPLANYNDAAFPIVVQNIGASPDRYLIQFTGTTAFRLIGENQGILAVGSITEDFAPISALTGEVLMTIDYRGWGLGWPVGGCLRFNIDAANYPIDVIRAVQPSDPTGLSDAVELLLIGNVDA